MDAPKRMNREELLLFHRDLTQDARDLMELKNHDYAGDAEHGSQPFANFERVKALGICSVEQGFLVRMTDKMSRLSSYVQAGKLEVRDESVRDTLIDLINYSVLLAAFLADEARPDGR
jgi:hypothetical protein